jgi:hypothetical protein
MSEANVAATTPYNSASPVPTARVVAGTAGLVGAGTAGPGAIGPVAAAVG